MINKLKMTAPGIDLDEWAWPEFDTKLIQVFDQVQDINKIMPFVSPQRTCIQAGGACGAWPKMFAQHFDLVYTFEPEPTNFECLLMNCNEDNIICIPSALGESMGEVALHLDDCESTNAGAWYAYGVGNTPMCTIDSLNHVDVDLIQLDVEGYELEALRGAYETIRETLPVIVLEEKRLPHMNRPAGLASAWLAAEFGYEVVMRVHRDVILKANG